MTTDATAAAQAPSSGSLPDIASTPAAHHLPPPASAQKAQVTSSAPETSTSTSPSSPSPAAAAAKATASASPPSDLPPTTAPVTRPRAQPDALDLSSVDQAPPPPPSLSPPAYSGFGAPPMKDRTVSASTDRSRVGVVSPAGHPHMSVSPSHRLGSRSPASIPSSPTSVHSSSSAIFERDIEIPPFTSLPLPHSSHPPNPHRTPRSKATETLETSVPSVLDSAATLLATSDASSDLDVAVEAPMPLLTSAGRAPFGSTSPVGRGSRSPSPTTSMGAGGKQARTSMLLNLPSPVQGSVTLPGAGSPTSSDGRSPPTGSPNKVPPPLTTNLPASISPGEPPMPGGFGLAPAPSTAATDSNRTSSEGSTVYESAMSGDSTSDDETAEEGQSSPRTTTLERPPGPLPLPVSAPSPTTPTAYSVLQSQTHAHSLPAPVPNQSQVSSPISNSGLSYPPSPSHGSGTQKRLSFLAYADVRAGAPVSTRPLSQLTYSAPGSGAGAGSASPGSPGSGIVGAGVGATSVPEEPPHLPAVEGALEGAGVIEPSAASVLGMSFGPAYGAYGSRSASAATSARNSLVLDALPAVFAGSLVGSGSGAVVPGLPAGQAHPMAIGMGARPHSVYSHGAAADVKEPGSEDGELVDGVDASNGLFGSGTGRAEWEREGLGRGLEERLEAVLG